MDLCRTDTTEQSGAAWNSSHGFCWWEPGLARWKQRIHEIRCQQQFLENSFGWWLKTVDHLCHLLWFASTTCPLELVLHLKYFSEPCQKSWRTLMESYVRWTTSLSMEETIRNTMLGLKQFFFLSSKSWTDIEHSEVWVFARKPQVPRTHCWCPGRPC